MQASTVSILISLMPTKLLNEKNASHPYGPAPVMMHLEKTMENEKKKTDFWQVAFAASVFGIIPGMVKYAKDLLPFSVNGIVLAAIIGAAGASIGFGIYILVKNKRTSYKVIAYILLLKILVGGTLAAAKFSSDSYIVKKEWNLIKNGNLSFEYPNPLIEMKTDDKPENVEKLAYFLDKKEDRFAMNFIFDFKEEPPAPEDSLSGAILNSLGTIKASDVEWIDSQFSENSVTTKVRYKTGNNERTGFGIIYFKDWHYELALFLPYTKDYSEEFLNKIISSIKVDD